MFKEIDDEIFEKYTNLVLYTNKMESLKIVTKGHKQRFINMVLELLKYKGKNLDAQLWIYFTLINFEKQINKSLKAVDEHVALKLEQQIKEIISVNPYNVKYKQMNNENINPNKAENKLKKEKDKEKIIKEKENEADINNNINIVNINNDEAENKTKKKIFQLLEKINNFTNLKAFISDSMNQENRSNKIFCDVYQFLNNFNLSSFASNVEIGNININFRQKILNLICLVFPFISNKQKTQIIQKMKTQFESDAITILENSKFIDKSKKNIIFEFFTSSIISKELNKENLNIIFHKKLFINKSEEIFDLFKLYIIISIFKFKNYQECLNQISFKLQFILDNYKSLYNKQIKSNYEDIYNILLRLKKFYTNGYNNKLYGSDEIIDDKKEPILDLFSSEEKKVYDEVYENVKYLYCIKKNIDLISGYARELKNFEFPFNLIELIQIKNNLIKNNFTEYKKNLINIEKKIFQIGYESLFPNNNYNNLNMYKSSCPQLPFNNLISRYNINQNMKNIFNSLNNYLHYKLYNFTFNLYPYGSSTEFLSDKDSDIDLFLDMSQIESKEQKLLFLHSLIYHLKYSARSVATTISTRVCVISFKYKNVNFDISIVGFSPYFHSVLIREYSLIDPRFPLLLIAIKHMIKLLNINNVSEDKNHSYLNSFSWSLLLIAFLQDIVTPPVIPKILSNSEILTTQSFFGNNKIEKEEEEKNAEKNNIDYKFEKAKLKNFESFINNMEINDVSIPFGLGNINQRIKNYQKQIKEKNNMTCSELLLKFLEFVIYHFKYDTIFVNCSFQKEGFQNMDAINYFKSEEDSKFVNYFKTKYIKRIKEEKSRDGYFLLRDPFDPRYNPGQTLKANSLKKFFSRLKLAYYHLLQYGNLNMLKKQVEIEDEIKRGNKF